MLALPGDEEEEDTTISSITPVVLVVGSSVLWGWIDRWLCGWWWCFVGISQQKQFNWFNRSLNWRGLNEDYLFLISFPSAELHSSRRSSVWPRKWAPTQWANDIGSFVFLPPTTTIVLFLCSCCWPRSFLCCCSCIYLGNFYLYFCDWQSKSELVFFCSCRLLCSAVKLVCYCAILNPPFSGIFWRNTTRHLWFTDRHALVTSIRYCYTLYSLYIILRDADWIGKLLPICVANAWMWVE